MLCKVSKQGTLCYLIPLPSPSFSKISHQNNNIICPYQPTHTDLKPPSVVSAESALLSLFSGEQIRRVRMQKIRAKQIKRTQALVLILLIFLRINLIM